MRGISLVSLLFLVTACGPSKPAADPTTAEEPAPKWDSSSETASNPPSSHKASPSSQDDTTPAGVPGADTSPPAGGGGGGSSASAHATPSAGAAGGGGGGGGGGDRLPADFGGASYPRDQTEVVLRRAARQVKGNCGAAKDENGNAPGPWGKTTMTITLGHNGHTRDSNIPAPFDSKPAGRCAVQAFRNLTFPPFAGPDVDVQWDVELVKP